VKDSAKRSETFKNSIEKAGGKLVSTYYTLGQYDGVSIVEASDDATIMSSLLSYESQQGSSTTMTLKAFTAEQTATILEFVIMMLSIYTMQSCPKKWP
jgi:uncharacterized protein with GYD domain